MRHPRNVQVVTDIVQEGKYAGKFTIHEDDVFNDRQLRVQVGGPRVTVEEGSDTYMSFFMYMAEAPKDRDNFFYWEGNPPPRYNNVMTWWVEPKEGGGAVIKYGDGQPWAQRHGLGSGLPDRQMASSGDAHPLVGGSGERKYAAMV